MVQILRIVFLQPNPYRNVGDPITFKVHQCNEDLYKRNICVHRGVVVPRSQTSLGYNSTLAPKSEAYFSYVQLEGGATSKISPLCHQGTVGPPNITISEVGGKRHKPWISLPTSVESDISTAGPNEAVVDVSR